MMKRSSHVQELTHGSQSNGDGRQTNKSSVSSQCIEEGVSDVIIPLPAIAQDTGNGGEEYEEIQLIGYCFLV